MVQFTCRAGSAQATARVLVRPDHRPRQTDEQWHDDQNSLISTVGQMGGISVLSSMLDRLAPTASAQTGYGGDFGNSNNQVGTPPFMLLEPTRLGSVLGTTNFELAMPVANLGGRGLATNLTLYYNSSVWGTRIDPSQNYATVYTFDPIQSWPSPGFSLGFGRIVYHSAFLDPVTLESKCSYLLVDPDGTRHNLGIGLASGSNTLQSTDGTHLTYVGDINGGSLYYNDGTKVTFSLVNNRRLATQITDTNGNYIQIAYKWSGYGYSPLAIDYVIDTLGRVIQFNYNSANGLDLTSVSAPGGGISLSYQSVSLYKNFQVSGGGAAQVENAPTSFNAIRTVGSTHSYQFTYSNWGMIYNVSIDGGSASMSFDYPVGAPYEELYSIPQFSQRTESPNAVYTYGSGITRPDGTVLTLGGGVRELKSSTGVSVAKTVYTTTTDPGGSAAMQSITTYNEIGQQTKVAFDYDQYGNVVNKREYGFQVNGTWQARRRTHYTYWNSQLYIDAYIRNRVMMIEVYDALQNTNDADDVLVGKTIYQFDSYGAMGGMEGYGGTASPPGHLLSYNTGKTVRGNVTGVTSYTDLATNTSVTRGNKLDIFGNVVKAQVACCEEKTFTTSEATYWSRPEQETTGNPSGISLTSTKGYDFSTLAMVQETDPNNRTTSYSYDSEMRPTGFTSPAGASGTTSYNVWGEGTSSSMTYTEGGVNKTISTSAVYDAWGQMIRSIDANGAQVNYAYDVMGRLISQTNPFPQGGTPGPATTFQNDLLGRVTLATLPGGNTVRTDYSGSIATVTDQVNRKMKRESDGLGRLIKVTEQNAAGALTQETIYTYDITDRLTLVNQGGQLRSFKYNTAGNLLFERIPEQQATINDGTGTMWTSKYTYTDWGAVSTRTDARGVVTNYGYDTLHRLTSISYNISNAPGVDATPTVTYTYDNNSASTTKGLLLSLSVGSNYSESYGYDSFKRVSSVTHTIDGRSYTTSYQMTTANQRTQITYPSTRVINFGHDNKGRITSVGSFLSSVTYNGIGQVTNVSLGNGVTESYTYDAQRMQMTTQSATASGGPAGGLMNLTYGYQGAAGQNGAGTTAGNSGQLMSISGTIGGLSESADYSYDLWRRLVTSSQNSNGAGASREFSYDRWGNRTQMINPISGDTQTINLQMSAGASTNRIRSVQQVVNSWPHATFNEWAYTYDAAGNVANDGVHAYTYDAENRLVSVDGGVTAQYSYDQQNRRVKKTAAGASTHYVWEGSQVLAEHNASTGAVIADYINSGHRMIASISGGITNYMLSDKLSTRLVIGASGNVTGRQAHLPFGEGFAEIGTQEKHHFTTYERDSEINSDYAMNREYSQAIGRFNRVDPLASSSKNGLPQTWNRYSYSLNDPINKIDPLGLFAYPGVVTSGPPCVGFGEFGFLGTSFFDVFPMLGCEDYASMPSESFILPPVTIFPGTLTVENQCEQVIYCPEKIPEYERTKNPADAWKEAVGVNQVDADFVGTPRGTVKIPNGCDCNVSCSGGADYKVVCKCTGSRAIGFTPHVIDDYDSGEFPNPRKVEKWNWVGRANRPYQMTRSSVPPAIPGVITIPFWDFYTFS